MGTTRARVIGAAAMAAAGLVLAGGTAAGDDGGRPFRLALSGAAEFGPTGVPINPHGNADRGSIELRVNPGQEEVCWAVGAITMTAGESLPAAAHIHVAPAGIAGPVVIPLFGGATAPTAYPTGTRCVTADRDLLRAIMVDPSAYYVNLHNAQHPAGVMRAQLG